MAIAEKLNTLLTAKQQQDEIVEAVGILKSTRDQVAINASKLQAIADSGSFDTIDAELKTVLVAAKAVVDNCDTAFNDADIAELLE